MIPGFVGVFRPERLAEVLMLAPETAAGWVSVRVLIGAPYMAMALVTILGALRGHCAWLVPVAATEGAMMIVRIMSGFTHGFEAAGVSTIIVEAVICIVLAVAAILPARSVRLRRDTQYSVR